MLKIVILEKTYNVAKHSSAKALDYILKEELKDLNVKIVDITFTKDRYAEITLDGEDEKIAKNFIVEKYGSNERKIGDIQVGEIIYGRFKDVGKVKFGLFVDAGIETSTQKIDALYPLFKMREQLAGGKKTSLVNTIRALGIVENLPLKFEIIEKKVLGSKVWVKISDDSLRWFLEPFKENKEALIICGTTRRSIKQALIQSKHIEDIDEFERIGLLEYRLVCKRGTRADGLIPELGSYLG
ncbi:MAG: DUF2110 family protein, partial [Candidatus Heimdallarchaeota archaeon]|nr:DUF2110 family protein [Candidatus Heimdallarchaeota archaeon]